MRQYSKYAACFLAGGLSALAGVVLCVWMLLAGYNLTDKTIWDASCFTQGCVSMYRAGKGDAGAPPEYIFWSYMRPRTSLKNRLYNIGLEISYRYGGGDNQLGGVWSGFSPDRIARPQ